MRELALAEGSKATAFVVHVLSRSMTSYYAFSRISAKLLVDILKVVGENKEIVDWMKRFVTMLVIFMKIASEQDSFKKRVNLLCEVLTSEVFKPLPWFRNILQSTANAVYLIDQKPEFFKLFFKIGEKYPSASFFKREYDRYKPLIRTRMILKYFPFKINNLQLISPKDVDNDDEEEGSKQPIDDSLKELGIGARSLKYIFHDFDAGVIDQQQNIFLLEDFMEQETNRFKKTELYHENFIKINLNNYTSEGKFVLCGLKCAMQDIENSIWEYQIRSLKDFIGIANEIISVLKQHPHLMARIKALGRDLNVGCSDDQNYKLLKEQRSILKKRIEAKFRFEKELNSNLLNVFYKFDSFLQYVPPSDYDYCVDNFITFSEELNPMIESLIEIVSSEAVDSTIQTVWEFASVLYEKTKFVHETTYVLCYIILMRLIFDKSYEVYHPLTDHNSANMDFLMRCKVFSEKSVSELNLPEKIISRRVVRGTIGAFFKTKSHSLYSLEFLVNPIDILFNIHQTVVQLNSIAPGENLSNDEKVTLMKGLISTFPPSNTISIVLFLDKWGNTVPSANMLLSYSIFRKAVNSL